MNPTARANPNAPTATTIRAKVASGPNCLCTQGTSSSSSASAVRAEKERRNTRLCPARATGAAMNTAMMPRKGSSASRLPICDLSSPTTFRKSTKIEPKKV